MRTLLPIVPLTLLLTGKAPGQETADPLHGFTRLSPVQRYDSGAGLQREGDVLLALGTDYKARLDAAGMTFIPALGSRAPRLFPVGFQLESIERGGETILASPAAVEPFQDGLTAVYERAGGIEERYEARAEGLEQSFVFAAEPGAAGDLVVRGRIASELAGLADGSSVLFAEPELGGVRFSPVVAVDASGERADGWMRLDGGELLLGIPGAFVDSAAYPLTLDPLIGTEIDVETGTTIDDQECDAAFSQEHDAYLVAWNRVFSSTDVDVRAQRVGATGSLVGSLTAINTVSGICDNVAVAYVPLSDRWLIAYNQSTGIFDDSDVYARAFSAIDGTTSAEVAIATTATSESGVDLGSEATFADNEALCTYNLVGSGIRAVQINVPTSGDPFVFGSTLSVTTDADDTSAHVSKSGGSNGQYLIAWQRLNTTTGYDVLGRVVDRNATAISLETTLSNTTGSEGAVAVDGNGDHWVVAWQDNNPAGNGDGNIMAAQWHLATGIFGTTVLDTYGGTKTVEAGAGDDEVSPDVVYNGEACVVTWSDETLTHYDVRGAVLDLLSGNVAVAGFNVASSTESELNPVLAAEWTDLSQSANDDDVLFLWDETDTTTGTGEIAAQLYSTDVGTNGDLGGGCGSGGKAWATCALVGNANFAFTQTGTLASASTFLLLSTEGVSLPCGTCVIHADPGAAWIGATLADSLGHAAIGMAIPSNSALSGVSFVAQWATPGFFGSGACAAFGVDLSNGLTVVLE